MRGRASGFALCVAVTVSIACSCGGGDSGPEDNVIEGVWVHEGPDGPDLARTITLDPYYGLRSTDEYYYVDGAPVHYRHGFAYLMQDEPLPGGEIADLALVIYYDGVGFYTSGMGYDTIDRISDDTMVLQGLYDLEPVTYQKFAALP
jgi:hypothetical protein